jgi:hypothetical protein
MFGLASDDQQTVLSTVESAPFVVVEATLPSGAIILNQSIPLKLFVKGLRNCDRLPAVRLQTLTITLHTTTTINNEAEKIAWSTNKDIFSAAQLNTMISFDRQGDNAVYEIDCSLWSNACIQGQTLSFTTCTAKQEHSLVVTTGISNSSDTQMMVLSIPSLHYVERD